MSHIQRHHRGPGFYAFVVLRLSGVALALFLPLHFLALGLALEGAAGLDLFLAYTDQPLVKAAEWLLVMLLSVHLFFGLRVLLIEYSEWRGRRFGWLSAGLGVTAVVGAAFLIALAP